MDAKFENGTFVTRIWMDNYPQSTDILAAFQYEVHAFNFAKMLSMDETLPRKVKHMTFNSKTGEVRIFNQPPKEETK